MSIFFFFFNFMCHHACVIISICMVCFTGVKEYAHTEYDLKIDFFWCADASVVNKPGGRWAFSYRITSGDLPQAELLNLVSLGSLYLAFHVFLHSVVHCFISKPTNTSNSDLYIISRLKKPFKLLFNVPFCFAFWFWPLWSITVIVFMVHVSTIKTEASGHVDC